MKSVALLAGGAMSAQVIAIVSTPVVTRLYDVEDFGVFTIFVSILAIATPLSTLRYSVTIPIAENDELADDLLRLCMLVTVALSALAALALVIFGPFFDVHYSGNPTVRYFWLLPICLLGIGFYEALSGWSLRHKQFKLIARTRLMQGLATAGTKITLGWLGVRPLGLLLGHFFSGAAGSMGMLAALRRDRPAFFRELSWSRTSFAARRFVRFPLIQTWSQLLLGLGMQLPPLLIASLHGTKAAGLFGLAFTMVNIPMNILGRSVAQAYFAEIAQLGKERPEEIRDLSLSILGRLFLVAVIPVGAIAITAPWLFAVVFGEQWLESGIYARYLSLYIFSIFVTAPIAHCLNIFEAQVIQIVVNCFRVMVPLAVFYACDQLEIGPQRSVMFFSVAAAIYQLCLAILLFAFLGTQARKRRS